MRKKMLITAVILIIIAAITTLSLHYIINSSKTNANINKEENITVNKEENITGNIEKKLDNVEPIVFKINDNVYCEVLPEMELLSGLMSQTQWIKDFVAISRENLYFKKIQEFFLKYSDHKAVKLTNILVDNYGLKYSHAIDILLCFGKLPNLDKIHEYPNSTDKELLDKYRLALIQIAEDSNFIQFFEDNRKDLTKYLEDSLKNLDLEKAIEWNNNFYGYSPASEYRLVFAPAYFPLGGFAPQNHLSDGSTVFYQFITNLNYGTTPGLGSKFDIMYMTLHEWGHLYSNPVLAKFEDDFYKYELYKFVEPVKELMYKSGYNEDIKVFLNEQVLRGCVITGLREIFSEEEVNFILNHEKMNGFYLTEFTAEVFKEYTSNRDRYKTYEDFIPYLLQKYNENRDELLKLAEDINKNN